MAADLARSVVVPRHHHHGDPRVVEPAQLADPEQPRVEVPPVAVEDVAGQDHQVDLTLDGGTDEVLHSPPRSPPDLPTGAPS